jgi:putative molybdopterin biosynthesis protein
MRLIPTVTWRSTSEPAEDLDRRLVPLLEAVEATGSLAGAVASCRLSYRAAWGLLRDYALKLGAPLVELERGRGARLAAAGDKLITAHRAAMQRLERSRAALTVDLDGASARAVKTERLSMAASHDLALAALRDALPGAARLSLDLAFMGSLHALERFAAGGADLAGFHVPVDDPAPADLAPFHRLLRGRRNRLIRFVDRDQGFMLPRGNPARVRAFRDLVRKQLRFVNRQRGSGTRLLIDRLIAGEKLASASVIGFGHEEFTHAAVAATVASRAADAGFGLRAAAAEYGLAFVPRVRERYYFAAHASMLGTPALARLVDALRGPLLVRAVGSLPGYRFEGAGEIVGVDALRR